ncbi:MAG: polysaccharide biosynthesis tyrosine autokinase [Coleofasciculus sp. S288]|nr:polysaccharide biosynthesis tyrosine autokinase [Coleofasciculus sp. S288]
MESKRHGEEDIDLQKVWLTLKRRWLAIVGVCGISVGLAAYYYSQQDPVYQAQGKLLVNKINRASSLTGLGKPDADTINPLGQQSNPLDTEAEVIRSIPIAQEVITKLNLKNESGEPMMPQQLLGRLSAKSISSTDVLEISYKSTDPKEAAAVVNKLMDVYIQNEIGINRAEASAAGKFIANQLPKTEAYLKDIEDKLRQFKERNKVVALQQEAESAVSVIANLDQKIADTQAQLADATTASRALQSKLGMDSQQAIALSSLSQASGVGTALEELQKVQTELATARSRYEEAHPTVENLKLKEANLRDILQERVRQIVGRQESIGNLQFSETQQKLTEDLVQQEVRRLGLSSQVTSLSNVQFAYKQRVSDIPQLEQRQQELERQREAAQSTYITLSQRLQEVKVRENQNVGNVRLISEAIAPNSPIAPEKTKILGLGGASGLLLGIAMAFLLDLGDASIRTIKEAREKFKYTVLGTIPLYGDTPRRGLLRLPNLRDADSTANAVPVKDKPRSPVGEAYRMLQANLKFLNSDRQIKVIVVGSSVPNEGKSSVSANLAATMAQLGRRILLIDADLHRPSQHHIWQLTNQAGLSNVLVGQVEFSEAVQTPMERLDVLPSGAIPPNPLALLDSKRMTSLVESFAQEYDFVIIDAPPLLVAADALTLGKMTDGMLLVVRPGIIDSASANKTKELLQQSGLNVLGLVINGVIKEHESDRFFYYMKAYHATEIDATAWEGTTSESASNANN